MINDQKNIWDNRMTLQLAQSLADISDVSLMQNFLRDVMTEKEITELSARLEAAKTLQEGKTYTEIAKQSKLSSRTIARISQWLQNGTGGYSVALQLAAAHHDHLSPARAE